jgi:hypothetical protein
VVSALKKSFAAVLLAGALIGAGASPTMAGAPTPGPPTAPNPDPGPPQEPGPVTGPAPTQSSSSAVGQVSNCSVVSSPSFLGLSCGGDGSYTRKSVKEILKGDPVPGCWDEKLTDSELQAMDRQNGNGSTWYWERCLTGINPKTLKIAPGGVQISMSLKGIKDGDKVTTLTGNQAQLVNFYTKNDQIPLPIAAVSPMAHPRVGGWVSFFDGAERHEVVVQAGAVVLRAREVSIDVEPLGKGKGDVLSCAGSGYRAERGESPIDHPKACWYKYPRSSAEETDNAYPVNVTAHWDVDVSAGGVAGPFTPFNSFTKSMVTQIPVTEIQALVVP